MAAPAPGLAAPVWSTSVRMAVVVRLATRTTGRRAVGPSASEPLPMPTDHRLGFTTIKAERQFRQA